MKTKREVKEKLKELQEKSSFKRDSKGKWITRNTYHYGQYLILKWVLK